MSKNIKYYLSIFLSALSVGAIAVCIYMLTNPYIDDLKAVIKGESIIDHPIIIVSSIIIILGILSYKPLEMWRKTLRDEVEYDEEGVSKKYGNFMNLSATERKQIEQQKMINAEMILDSPTVKKITHRGAEDPVKAMNALIGLPKVKQQMRQMAARMQYDLEEHEHMGKPLKKNQTIPHSSMHMCFYGPPGTGKTTCARIMTGFLYRYRYIKKNQCVEIDGNFLRGMTPGESTKKTKMVIQKALGGVLFIDEAYSILNSRDGQEVLATIVKEMEDRREDIIFIFAGYEKEMKNFINANPGLESRIKYNLWFGNYTINDLSEIFRIEANKKNFVVSAEIDEVFRDRIEREMHNPNFGNARTVRTILEKAIDKHAVNCAEGRILDEERHVLKQEDMPGINE